MLFWSNKSIEMIEFVSNCSHKKNWTPKPNFGYDFAGIFILWRLKMYTLTTLKSKPLPFPIYLSKYTFCSLGWCQSRYFTTYDVLHSGWKSSFRSSIERFATVETEARSKRASLFLWLQIIEQIIPSQQSKV